MPNDWVVSGLPLLGFTCLLQTGGPTDSVGTTGGMSELVADPRSCNSGCRPLSSSDDSRLITRPQVASGGVPTIFFVEPHLDVQCLMEHRIGHTPVDETSTVQLMCRNRNGFPVFQQYGRHVRQVVARVTEADNNHQPRCGLIGNRQSTGGPPTYYDDCTGRFQWRGGGVECWPG